MGRDIVEVALVTTVEVGDLNTATVVFFVHWRLTRSNKARG